MTKKILKGTVKSAKNNKTIVVEVTRKFKHPFYEKIIKRIDLSEVLICSDVNFSEKFDDSFIESSDNTKIKMKVEVNNGEKCVRCWKIFKTLNTSGLCSRCQSVVNEKN